nr:shikimate 5-dehydrogenase [Raoultella sp. NCTC 9187]
MTHEMTPLLRAAQARGCAIQRGTDMLFEMIPAYLRFSVCRWRRRSGCGSWRKFATETRSGRLP